MVPMTRMRMILIGALYALGTLGIAGNAFLAGKDFGAKSALEAYKKQEVTLGPLDHPECRLTLSVEALVAALQDEGLLLDTGWFHESIRWLYLCGEMQAEKDRMGVVPYCEDPDRCA
jgi:hypothetical protein